MGDEELLPKLVQVTHSTLWVIVEHSIHIRREKSPGGEKRDDSFHLFTGFSSTATPLGYAAAAFTSATRSRLCMMKVKAAVVKEDRRIHPTITPALRPSVDWVLKKIVRMACDL